MARPAREKPPLIMVEKSASGALVPATPYDAEALDAVKVGAAFDLVRRQKARSNPQLRRYWQILQAIVDATEIAPSSAHLHERTMIQLGYATPVLDPWKGTFTLARDSVAFDAMTQGEFNEFADRAFAALSEALGIDVADLLPPLPGDRA